MEITYLGEQLLPGKLGNAFVILAMLAALISAISYFNAEKNPLDLSWKKLGRASFWVHSFSIFGIVATLFYLLFNHRFEYQYVWQHSNTEMPMEYILSCFWEGQEGSFLLWAVWHVVLGNILMFTSKNWENGVMAVFALVQMFLASMLLGIVVGDFNIGSNPFTLLREHPSNANLPFLKIPTYLENLDGRGLNPLLQNYWMTIHPPTLFLGFASTLVPFAYAIAGLFKKDYQGWMKPALPWSFFGVMILGTGILMGGAWAYEALSFGGFWAWDPVENASLVPWLTFVGAAHVMLIHKNKGGSLITTFVLTLLTFLFILYSTFLTRSGILGETSVHAFTDLGMSGQLLIYLLFFVLLSVVLLAINWKHFPKSEQEEHILSREFWMFIGALTLLISAFQIIFTTSIPVINKVFGTQLAPPTEIIAHYNSFQVPFAIIIALLTAIGQYFRYKKTEWNDFIKKLLWPFVIALVLSTAIAFALQLYNFAYFLLLFTSAFSVIANFNYLVANLKWKLKFAGGSIAHIGFALILLGALISTGKSVVISQNTSGVDVESLSEDFKNNENIFLNKGDTLKMGEYFVTYVQRKKEGINLLYQIDYLKDKNGKKELEFTLHPRIQLNPRMGNAAEPDTRHFLHKDVYSFISYAEVEKPEEADHDHAGHEDHEGFEEPIENLMKVGDTIYSKNSIIKLDSLSQRFDKNQFGLNADDLAVMAHLTATDIGSNTFKANPIFVIKGNEIVNIPAEIETLGVKFIFDKINPETGELSIKLLEKKGNKTEFIIMKAVVFPFINVLWLGCVIMVIGTIISVRYRISLTKN